ncbi:MAG: hypothetical protein AAF945_16280 [Actinomycetota bacterium]
MPNDVFHPCADPSADWSTDFGPGEWIADHWDNRALEGWWDERRYPTVVDENWGFAENEVIGKSDDFGIRYYRQFEVHETCEVQIRLGGDDGYAMWLDGSWDIYEWFDQPFTQTTVNVTLTAGWHTMYVFFYENGGTAQVLLDWRPV